MARRTTFRYGAYELSWLNGEACAVTKGEDGKRTGRYRLGRTLKEDGRAACQAALVAFVDAIQRRDIETDTTVEKVFDAYRAYLRDEGKVETPAITVWKHLGKHFARLSPLDITDKSCRLYAQNRQTEGASVGTIWTELNRLASAVGWAFKKNHISRKISVWQPLKPEGRNHVLSVEEVLRLVDACATPHMCLFVMLMVMGGGPRHRAVLELTWDRVDLENGTIDFRVQRQVSVLHKGHKKNRAKVPMTDTLKAMLQHHKETARTRFVIEYSGLAPLGSVKKGFEAAAKAAGLVHEKINRNGRKVIAAECTPHTLRHTVATWLDEDGVTSDRIAKVLGHKDKRTTEKTYTHTQEETLRPTVEKLDVFKQRGLKIVRKQ